jgi:uncharacterized protein (DUF1330 family)
VSDLPSIVKLSGTFLARGGAATASEGRWKPKRVILCEFRTVEDEGVHDSPEYAEAHKSRECFMGIKALIRKGV